VRGLLPGFGNAVLNAQNIFADSCWHGGT
jgi:hypothetical protein